MNQLVTLMIITNPPPPTTPLLTNTHTHTHTHFKKERNIPGMKSQPVVVNFWE